MAGPRPWHVPLIAAFPVAFLLAQNVEEAGVGEALPGLTVAVAAAFGLWGVAWLALREARRAALVVSGLVALTFAYGPASRWVAGLGSVGESLGRHRYLLPLWGLAAAGLLFGVARLRDGRLAPSTRWLNMASAILVAINVVPVAAYHAGGGGQAGPAIEDIRKTVPPATGPAGPDIYYLVFDRYGGLDALQEEFGFDNAPFLAELEQRGFSVAAESRANYPTTVLSLASSMNMAYLDPLSRAMGPGASDREPLAKLIRDHAVGRYLKARGYRYVHVGSWWEPTSASPIADRSQRYGGLSEFSQVLLDQTALAPVLRRFSPDLDVRRREYERVRFQFGQVGEAAADPGPTFVFAHFLIPHGPYVFRADGSFRAERVRRGRKQGYVDQLRYANDRILALVDRLLSGAGDPIIILQADEGPFNGPGNWRRATAADARRKFSILNAYHLPGDAPPVPPDLSPVNSFRMVLDRYLGQDLAMLPDRSFAPVSVRDFYTFLDMTDLAGDPQP